ncbi:hypothetical protein KY333_03600 [Candidatus Woesearchaeota archaeon]|nr:hypothetical protein [Candidatus Woesearchaeota archaeon]
MVKKEEIKTELDANPSASLEKRLGASVRKSCGLKIRTFDCISDLEQIAELKAANPVVQESGLIRADVMEAFYLSIKELMDQCQTHFTESPIDTESLIYTFPEQDKFLQLLNEKQFDGIHEFAEDTLRLKQYRMIKEHYLSDREAVINNLYIQHLNKGMHKKKRSPFTYVLFAGAIIWTIGALAQVGTYLQVAEIKTETKKEIQDTKEEFRGTVTKLEQQFTPKNMIKHFETWANTDEGKQYLNTKYALVKDMWIREGLVTQEFDNYWRNKAMPLLEKEYELKKLKKLADNLERFAKMFPK